MHVIGRTIALIGFLALGAFIYEDAKSKYDPEAVCAKQKDVSVENCRAAVGMAMSAGW